jgi:hypothetical protein
VMTEMQHLLLLLQEHPPLLLLRRRHLRLQRHQLRPRLLVKVSFRSYFLDSSSSSFLSGYSAASVWCLCVCEPVSLWFCCVYLCGSSPGILVAMRSGWVSRKSAFSLARARSLVSANPNKRSVGTQNDLDHHQSHDSDLAIVIWISPPFRQYTLFLSLGISHSNRSIRRAETREKSESYSPFRTR